MTANCQPCLETSIAQALECGADEQDVAEAIGVGKMVRKGAASKMDQFISSLRTARSACYRPLQPRMWMQQIRLIV